MILVQSEETSKLQVPENFFDYLCRGKLIFAIMPECETADILHHSCLGFIHPSEDTDGIADTLVNLCTDWRAERSEYSIKINRGYVNQISVKHLPDRLESMPDGLL